MCTKCFYVNFSAGNLRIVAIFNEICIQILAMKLFQHCKSLLAPAHEKWYPLHFPDVIRETCLRSYPVGLLVSLFETSYISNRCMYEQGRLVGL